MFSKLRRRDVGREMFQQGCTLYNQQMYSEAEGPLRQAADGRERTLGRDHKDTLDSKHWLGSTLYRQQKYSEAEGLLRQAADGRERILGRDHEDTLATVRLLHELQLASFSLPTSATTQNAPAGRLTSFFQEGKDGRESYTDSEISEISSLLRHSNPQWSRVPRTYVILRTIGHLNLLDDLIDVGFSDYWFPVTERNLPDCLRPGVRTAFFSAQRLVLTMSMGLEKGEKGQHCHFKQGESLPFEPKEVLGSGGFGQVDKVVSLISFKEYARKRVLRSAAFSGPRKEHLKQFIAEIQILKRLRHYHIVEFVGSYTDPKYIGLIMSPVAEMDLAAYLKRANNSNLPELRTFFGCLATALEYLHAQKVRHKDIKPGNILVDRGNILFADFGLSLDFADADGSISTSMVNGLTPRYCAPEVAQYQPRNTASDIWSLGVVFMEMIVVLKGRTVQYMNEFFSLHGSQGAFVRTNPVALLKFVAELERIGELSDNRALGWTQQMLSAEQQLRPTASSLVAWITSSSQGGERMSFCGICCVPPEEEQTSGYTTPTGGDQKAPSLLTEAEAEAEADQATANHNSWTPLHSAASNGHVELAKLLLESGADISVANNNGFTPLNTAADAGHVEVAKLLLENGADMSVASNNGWTPLYSASLKGHTKVAKLLLEKGADVTVANNNRWTPLNVAAGGGHVEVAKLLLEKGADVTVANNNGFTPLNTAADAGYVEVAKLLLENGADISVASNNGWTPLNAAASHSYVEVAKLLLERRADMSVANNNGFTPLNTAADAGHVEVAKLLLEKGADMSIANSDGATPLYSASVKGHTEMVALLLEKGADITVARVDGWTPLNAAVSNGHVDVAKLLLESGADMSVANSDGATPLYSASVKGHTEIVALLLEKGADMTVARVDGWTPLNAAVSNGHVDVAKLLLLRKDKGATQTTAIRPR